jgi:NAD(P)-dependent dehydrogenase (short-subunit alcohol dehydrogenase family)
VAVVTGASSGLGEGLARALSSVGARVAVVARRYDRLVKLADEIGGMAIGCDLLDLDRVGEVVPQVVGELGGPVARQRRRALHDRPDDRRRRGLDRPLDEQYQNKERRFWL